MRPDPPPGYRIRPGRLDDIPAVAAVGRACNLVEIGEFDVHESWLHDEWMRPRFQPSTNAWVVTEPGAKIVAAAYTWDEEPHTIFDSAGWVHPEHRGRGIGTALVLAVERRAMRDVVKVPAGSAPRVLQSYDADDPVRSTPMPPELGRSSRDVATPPSASTCIWRSPFRTGFSPARDRQASPSGGGSRPMTARSSP